MPFNFFNASVRKFLITKKREARDWIIKEMSHSIVGEMRPYKNDNQRALIPKSAFKYVCIKLRDLYPDVIKDRLDGKRIGNGINTLLNACVEHNNYMNRLHKTIPLVNLMMLSPSAYRIICYSGLR